MMKYLDVGFAPFDLWLPEKGTREAALTGCSAGVQGGFVRQDAAATAVRFAVQEVESRQLKSFTFACDRGTHASPACALLMAMLAYPKARVCFHQSSAAAALSDLITGGSRRPVHVS